MKNKKNIIWDWNGTLLNDADLCVECMNIVLRKHLIEEIDLKKYRNTFTFPVKDYYSNIGFDFNKIDFKIPAMEFINHYYAKIPEANLHHGTTEVLNFFRQKGLKQYVLSAMEHSNLVTSLTEKGIINYFESVHGIDDHYAHSKLEIGSKMMDSISRNPTETIMMGDTIHDFEVALGLGVDCILISNGHQSTSRLNKITTNVIGSLGELANYKLNGK